MVFIYFIFHFIYFFPHHGTLFLHLYRRNTTECLQHKPQTGSHKTVVRKLLSNLLMVSFENATTISFKMLNNGPVFDLIETLKNSNRTALIILNQKSPGNVGRPVHVNLA